MDVVQPLIAPVSPINGWDIALKIYGLPMYGINNIAPNLIQDDGMGVTGFIVSGICWVSLILLIGGKK